VNSVSECNQSLTIENELDQHLPKAFQTMLKIEQMAQDRLQQIKISVERGETTIEAVKQERGLFCC
jgi:transcription initiation factor IIF auxiliary subunit